MASDSTLLAQEYSENIKAVLTSNERSSFLAKYPQFAKNYAWAEKRLRDLKCEWAFRLKRVITHPHEVQGPKKWFKSQTRALDSLSYQIGRGLNHPVIELPPGSGKSKLIGAEVRCFLDAWLKNNKLSDVEVLILTSRSHLVGQLVGKKFYHKFKKQESRKFPFASSSVENEESVYDVQHTIDSLRREHEGRLWLEDDDEGAYSFYERPETDEKTWDDADFNFDHLIDDFEQEAGEDETDEYGHPLLEADGDVTEFLRGLLNLEHVRVITGNTNLKERTRRNSVVTFLTYQGFNVLPLQELFPDRSKVRLVVCDESHNLSVARQKMIRDLFPAAFRSGTSATVVGPQKSPPFPFFDAVSESKKPEEQMAFCADLHDIAADGELKTLRYLAPPIAIDFQDVHVRNGVANDRDVDSKLLRKSEILAEFIVRVFETRLPLLDLFHSLQPSKRKWFGSVRTIALAERLVEDCKKLGIAADSTSGKDKDGLFEKKIDSLVQGRIQILFSDKKLLEGTNVPEVNGIIHLAPYQRRAKWIVKQFIGRGYRVTPNGEDCLLVEPKYDAGRVSLATIPSVLGFTSCASGGVVLPLSQKEDESALLDAINTSDTAAPALKSLSRTIRSRINVPALKELYLERKDQRPFIPVDTYDWLDENIARPKVAKVAKEKPPVSLERITERELLLNELRRELQERNITNLDNFLSLHPERFSRKAFRRTGKMVEVYNMLFSSTLTVLQSKELQELGMLLFTKEEKVSV